MGITRPFGENNMFIGEYSYSIDSKRRVAIPAKFRRDLGKGGVITRGIDHCLVLYPLPVWQTLARKLQDLPAARGEARGFVRILLSGAADVKFDKLGRILVPDYLNQYANLKKNLAIIGLGNRIEIWDENKWQTYKNKTEKEVGDMASKLEELGI